MYNLINTVTVSRNLSSDAVAIMAACAPYDNLKSFIFAATTTGIGLVACRAMQGGATHFKKAFTKSISVVVVLILIGIISIPFIPGLLQIIHMPNDLEHEARGYLLFLILGACAVAGKTLLMTILSGMGEMKIISLMSAVGIVTETSLVLYLIAVRHASVWAASFAIFASDTLLFIVYAAYLVFKLKKYLREQSDAANIDTVHFNEIIFAAFAKPAMMGLVAVGSFFFQREFNTMSKNIIAGVGYANTLTSLFMEPLCALASLSAAIYAQSAYMINIDNSKKNVVLNRKKLNLLNVIWSLISIICIVLFAHIFIELLAGKKIPEETIAYGARYVRISIWGFPLLGAYLIDRAALHAIGSNIFLPLFGFLEMLSACAGALIFSHIFGFVAFPIAVLFKWILPGLASELIMWRKKI